MIHQHSTVSMIMSEDCTCFVTPLINSCVLMLACGDWCKTSKSIYIYMCVCVIVTMPGLADLSQTKALLKGSCWEKCFINVSITIRFNLWFGFCCKIIIDITHLFLHYILFSFCIFSLTLTWHNKGFYLSSSGDLYSVVKLILISMECLILQFF